MPLANDFLAPGDSAQDEPQYPLGVISCRSCRLMSVTHVVDPEVLYRSYPYVTSDSTTMTRHLNYVAQMCRRRFGLTGDSLVVEIGSNTGAQLMLFRDAGMRVFGIDPARNLTAVARRNGVDTLAEFFSPDIARLTARTHGRAQLILGRHVFAHIDDLAGVIAGVRELLTPDGVLVIEVPYLVDLLDKTAFDTIYHEHLSHFAVGALVTLFERYGLRVFDVQRIPLHGGSILVFVGHPPGPWQVRPSVREALMMEERAGLLGDAVYHAFAHNVRRIREELRSLIRHVRAQGGRIAGYGAPAKGNTILNVCGLGPAELDFCSDTTELKQGKLLPGTHIPVHPPGYAVANPPDYFLLLAWNFGEEILRKEAEFLDRGGRFILPIPEPRVISAGSRGSAYPVAPSPFSRVVAGS
jgi:novobiocin biosynthesis protein NovU/D-mycarose 3-C-methyltransferase